MKQSFPKSAWHCVGFVLLLVTAACQPPSDQGTSEPGQDQPGQTQPDPNSPPATTEQVDPAVDRDALPDQADVLLITVDTLRYDALGLAGGHDATPILDRLTTSGRSFSRAYAHNVVTLPSHANMLTGLYPYQHGVRDNSGFVLAEDVPTLATVLKGAGYATAAFVAAFPLDARFGLARGFDVYDDQYHVGRKANEFAVEARGGDIVVKRGLEWWREHAGERRFLWLHLYDPHAPYEPPPPFDQRFVDNPYRGEIAAVDHFLTPILEPILAGDEPDTLVVFTSDHGEAMGDHGELTHGLFSYQATLHVPLVLWGRGIVAGDDPRTVGHIDMLPTVLDLLALPTPPNLSGISLAGPAGGHGEPQRNVYFEALSAYLNRGWAPLHGLVRGNAKYVQLPVPEIYDLELDPAEADNLLFTGSVPPKVRRLYRSLRDAMPPTATATPSRRQIPEEEAAKLRALGYLASSSAPKSQFTEADDPKNLIALDRKVHQLSVLAGDGRWQEAEKLGRELIAERPEMSLTYLRLSTVLRERGRFGEAVELLRSALAHGLEQAAIVRELGLTLAEAGHGEEAAQLLEPLVSGQGKEAKDLKTLNALGVAYFAAGRLPDARRLLEGVLERDGDNLRALESLGAVSLGLRDPVSAIRHLESALAINPDLPIAWNTLGVARKWNEDVSGALEAWQKATDLNPALLDAWYNLGHVALENNRFDTARRAFEEYVARAPIERFPTEVDGARRILQQLGQGSSR